MPYSMRGEVEVEKGLGLPRATTTQRNAYTPPAKGYKVFDTDLNQEFGWDGAAWVGSAASGDIPDNTDYVDLTTAQTVSGTKTFTNTGNTTLVIDAPLGSNSYQSFRIDGTPYTGMSNFSTSFVLARNQGTTALTLFDTSATINVPLSGVTPTAVGHLTRKDYVDDADALKFDKTGGTITGDVSTTNGSLVIADATNEQLTINASTNGNAAMIFQRTGAPYGEIRNFGTRVEYTFSGGATDNTFTQYETYSIFDKVVRGVTPVGTTDLTTKSYVDDADALKLNLTGGSLTGNLQILKASSAVVLDSNTGTNSTLHYRINGTSVAEFSGLLDRARLTHKHSAAGTDTILELHDDYAIFDKVVRGVTPVNIADLTRKDYVDGIVETKSIGALSDVDITTSAPTDGQALLWNSTNSEFEPGTIPSAANFVDTTTAQSIAGIKTFNSQIVINSGTGGTSSLLFDNDSNDYSVGIDTGNFHITRLTGFYSDLNVGSSNSHFTTGTATNRVGLYIQNSGVRKWSLNDQNGAGGFTPVLEWQVGGGISGEENIIMARVKVKSPATVLGDASTTLVTKGYMESVIPDNTDFVDLTTAQTIAGVKTFSNNVVMNGDLTVNGTTTTVNTTNLAITDNQIILNDGEVGAAVTAGIAGIEIDRGTSTNQNLVFDDADDLWKIGETGSLVALATITDLPDNTDFVDLTTAQSIAGAKTFTNDTTIETATDAELILNTTTASSSIVRFRDLGVDTGYVYSDATRLFLNKTTLSGPFTQVELYDGNVTINKPLILENGGGSSRIDMYRSTFLEGQIGLNATSLTLSYQGGASDTDLVFGADDITATKVIKGVLPVVDADLATKFYVDQEVATISTANFVDITSAQTITGAKSFANDAFDVTIDGIKAIEVDLVSSDPAVYLRSDNVLFDNSVTVLPSQTYIQATDKTENRRAIVQATAAGGIARLAFDDTDDLIHSKIDAGLAYAELNVEAAGVASIDSDIFRISDGKMSYNKQDAGVTFVSNFTVDHGNDTFSFALRDQAIMDYSSLTGNQMDFGVKATSPVTLDGDDADVLTTKAWVLGKIPDNTNFVDLTTAQTIAGTKTFTSNMWLVTPTGSSQLNIKSSDVNGLSYVNLRDSTDVKGQLIGLGTFMKLRRTDNVGTDHNDLDMYDTYSIFNKVVRGVTPVGTTDLTTKAYVDGLIPDNTDFVDLTTAQTVAGAKQFSSDITISKTLPNLVLNASDVGSLFTGVGFYHQFGFKADIRYDIASEALTLRATGTPGTTELALGTTSIIANKVISGVTPVGSTDLTTKAYVDGLIPDNTDFVDLTTGQSIGGIKTFTSSVNVVTTTTAANITVKANAAAGTAQVNLEDSDSTQGQLIANDTRILMRRVDVGSGTNDFSVYDTYSIFNKVVRGVTPVGTTDLTTKAYVDNIAQPQYALVAGTGAAGYTVPFTLAGTIAGRTNHQVFVNGLKQVEGAGKAYTVAGSVVTFTAGNIPAVSDDVEFYGYG